MFHNEPPPPPNPAAHRKREQTDRNAEDAQQRQLAAERARKAHIPAHIGPLCLGVGLIVLTIGGVSTFRRIQLCVHGVSTSARVVAMESSRDSSGGDEGNRPTFQFTDAAGNNHTVPLDHYATFYHYRVGDQVNILYDPKDTHRLAINSFLGLWFETMILCPLGLAFTLVGGYVVSVRWRQ